MFWRAHLPSSILADQGICEDRELSSDGDKGDFRWLSAGPETPVEGLHVGIEASGAEGCEIENTAHGRSSAPDDANAIALARLICDRGEAGEHADLLGGQAADLGEPGDDGCGSNKRHTRDRSEDG